MNSPAAGQSRPVKDPRRHPCSHCGHVFGRKANLRSHEASVHGIGNGTDEAASSVTARPTVFACDECGVTFRRVNELRRHLKHSHAVGVAHANANNESPDSDQGNGNWGPPGTGTGTGTGTAIAGPPFLCELCGSQFARNDGLLRHIRTGRCRASRGGKPTPAPTPAHSSSAPTPTPSPPHQQQPLSPPPTAHHPLISLYPDFPPSLLPPTELLLILIARHELTDGVSLGLIHYPTLRADALSGKASTGLLAAVVRAALRFMDWDLHLETRQDWGWGWTRQWLYSVELQHGLEQFCFAWIDNEMKITLDNASRGNQDFERTYQLGTSLFVIRIHFISQGAWDLARPVQDALTVLVPRLALGELRVDKTAPQNMWEWFEQEKRRRMCALLADHDVFSSEGFFKVTPVIVHESAFQCDPVTQRFLAPWANMPAPAADSLFESGYPSPATRPPAPGTIFPLLIGTYFSWWSLPRDDPCRKSFLQRALGSVIVQGHPRAQLFVFSTWWHTMRYESLCLQRGYLLYNPPESDREVFSMRRRMLDCWTDIWAHLEPRLAQMDVEMDASGLVEVGASSWGFPRAHRPVGMLVLLHQLNLLLHAPYDVYHESTFDPNHHRRQLEAWPFSDSFLDAQVHAASISGLIRAQLRLPWSQNFLLSLVRVVARVVHIQVITARKLHKVATDPFLQPDQQLAARTSLETIKSDIDTLISSIELSEVTTRWGLHRASLPGLRSLARKAFEMEGGEDVWVNFTPEELFAMKG